MHALLSSPPISGQAAENPVIGGHEVGTSRPSRWTYFSAAVILPALIAVVGLFLWGYWRKTQAPDFVTAVAEIGRIDAFVAATGTCNAVVDVQVGSQVSGNIKALYADFNTRVKAGQLLALIDPEIFEARVKQAEAALRQSNAVGWSLLRATTRHAKRRGWILLRRFATNRKSRDNPFLCVGTQRTEREDAREPEASA